MFVKNKRRKSRDLNLKSLFSSLIFKSPTVNSHLFSLMIHFLPCQQLDTPFGLSFLRWSTRWWTIQFFKSESYKRNFKSSLERILFKNYKRATRSERCFVTKHIKILHLAGSSCWSSLMTILITITKSCWLESLRGLQIQEWIVQTS